MKRILLFAVLFVVPMYMNNHSNVNLVLDHILHKTIEIVSPDCTCWYFPESMRYFQGSDIYTDYSEAYWPGIIMTMKEIR